MGNKEGLLKRLKAKDLERRSNKIFGIGLPKTGTTSLTLALENLGYKTLHWPANYIDQRILSIPPRYWDCCPNKEGLEQQWDALTNFGENIYPLLDRDFPNSKFILTIRDKERWLISSERLFQITEDEYGKFRKYKDDKNWSLLSTSWVRRMQIYGCVGYDKDLFSNFYDNQRRNVFHYFKNRSSDFIVMDICNGDGWGKLCEFLKQEIPSIGFPHENKYKG